MRFDRHGLIYRLKQSWFFSIFFVRRRRCRRHRRRQLLSLLIQIKRKLKQRRKQKRKRGNGFNLRGGREAPSP